MRENNQLFPNYTTGRNKIACVSESELGAQIQIQNTFFTGCQNTNINTNTLKLKLNTIQIQIQLYLIQPWKSW